MATLSSAGKSGRRGLSRLRRGIRGSLFAAVAVIAGMAVLISAGAGLVPAFFVSRETVKAAWTIASTGVRRWLRDTDPAHGKFRKSAAFSRFY